MKARLHSKMGSTLIEAAILLPLVIAVSILSINTAMSLYTQVKENSENHKIEIIEKYEQYEKGRLYLSFYCDDFCVNYDCNDTFYHNISGSF